MHLLCCVLSPRREMVFGDFFVSIFANKRWVILLLSAIAGTGIVGSRCPDLEIP